MSEVYEPAPPPEARIPSIPVGLATKLGVYSSSVLAIVALVTLVLDGDYTSETLTALAGAVITLATTLAGRFAQAYALLRSDQSLSGIISAVEGINEPLPPSLGAPPPTPAPPIPPTAVPRQ